MASHQNFAPRGGRANTMRLAASVSGLAAALLLAQGASAQTYVNPNPGGQTVATGDDTFALQFAPATQVTNTANVTTTELIGILNGGKPIYDQTFTAAFSSPIVQAGVSAARLAITSAGGPGVIIGNPALVSHIVTTGTVSSTSYVLDRANTNGGYSSAGQPLPLFYSASVTTTDTFGPATLNGPQSGGAYASNGNPNTGFTDICTFPTTPTTTKPTCTAVNGGTFTVLAGQLDINVNLTVTYLVDTTTTTTTTTTTADVYDIKGVSVQGIGLIHAVVPVAGFDASEGFLERGLAEARLGRGDARIQPWFGYWGQSRSTAGTAGGITGNARSGAGANGGVIFTPNASLALGIGIDDGITHLALADGTEAGRLHLTQIAGFARLGAPNRLNLLIGAGYGWGAGDTTGTLPGSTEAATASEHLSTWVLGGELRKPLAVAGGRLILTPLLGASVTSVHLQGFAETGADFALNGPATTLAREQYWAGGEATIPLARGLSVSFGARAQWSGGDRGPSRAVSFINYPGVTGLSETAPATRRWAGVLNGEANLAITRNLALYAGGALIGQDGNTDKTAQIGLRVAL